jgi:hypothetical protein
MKRAQAILKESLNAQNPLNEPYRDFNSYYKSGGPCVDLGLDVLQSPHDSSTLACGARQEAEIASLIWTFEAVVDPVALCVRALLPEGW